MIRRIFISSVQRELAKERKAIVDAVLKNPQLARFFSTFAFEFDVSAGDKRTDEVYLAELAVSDVYVGIIGNDIKEKLDLRIGGHTLGAQSDDTFEIDERIVTEMINNGIAHRDYAVSATVQVELFRDRLTVFSPGPMHRDMKYEQLATEHPSYATNPIIAHALFYVKYIEELGSGTVDMFDICRETGLQPPVFDIDARHFSVTVYRPEFDEKGNRVPSEVGPKDLEVGPKDSEVGPKDSEVGPKPDFEFIMRTYRKDFRMTCARVWACLAADSTLSRRSIASELKVAESSVQSAMNALQEVGLLKREGYGKGRTWIVKTSAT